MQAKIDADDPLLPRRKAPARYEVGTGDGHHPEIPKVLYRQYYFECLDLIVTFIRDKFNQPGYQTQKNLENLLLKSVRNEE